MDIKEIAKLVRKEIKQEYPDIKTTTNIERFTGGPSMTVTIKDVPFNPFSRDVMEYGSISRWFEQTRAMGSDRYNTRYENLKKDIEGIMDQYNYDRSDSQIDLVSNKFFSFVHTDEEAMKKKYGVQD